MHNKIYLQYKLNNKNSCFNIYFETDNCISKYVVSFLHEFCEKKILKDLELISNNPNFKRWLTPIEARKINLI
ncbi:MAG: hypothetical protein IKT40_12050 [Bacilli bacterium]|nr:hypothetical protein [Bacilli bacterium]